MKWRKVLPVVLLPLVFVFLQCNDNDDDRVITVNMDQSFMLDYYQTAQVRGEDLEITFVGTAIDVRSPEHPEYMYPGYAEASFRVKQAQLPEELITVGITGAPTNDDCARLRTLWNGYYFELRSLYPDPKALPLHRAATPPMPPTNAGLMITRSAPPDSLTGRVIFSDYYSGLPHDEYDLENATISGDTLLLNVEYGGGCMNHYFFLYMAPGAFAESNPVQANLYLRHYKNNDNCRDGDCDGGRCWIERRLRFDLTPIRELHEQAYGTSGPIILNLYKYFDTEPGEKFVITYGE